MKKTLWGVLLIGTLLSGCSIDDVNSTNTDSDLQITAGISTATEGFSILVYIDGGTPPYEVQYTAINPTADTDLKITSVDSVYSDNGLKYEYEFTRENEREISPGKYKFTVTDGKGTIKTYNIVRKGWVIQYDPSNHIWYKGSKVIWSGYSGDVSAYNNEGYSFSVVFGEDAYFDYKHPRLLVSAPEGTTLLNGTNNFSPSLIGSSSSNQLQVQFETVLNNQWDIRYSSNTVSNQTGYISIDITSDDSNEYGLNYVKILFESVILSGWDSSTSSFVETTLSGVAYATYYTGD